MRTLALSLWIVLLCPAPATDPAGQLLGNNSPLRHVIGQPTVAAHPFQWVDLTPADALALKSTLMGHGGGTFRWTFGPGNVAADRAQVWVDAIHAEAKSLFETANPGVAYPVPKPEVLGIADAGINAWVTHVPVCLNAKLDVGIETTSTANVPVASISPNGVTALYAPSFGNPNAKLCAESAHAGELDAFVEYFNHTVESPCTVSRVGTDTIRVEGAECEFVRGAAFKTATKAAFYASAPRIMVTTGMFLDEAGGTDPAGAERKLAVVLAHEYAHYARAHAVHSLKYGYFYELTEVPLPVQPPAVADSAALEAEKKILFTGAPPIRVPNAKNNGHLTSWLGRHVPRFLASACIGSTVCPDECEQANEAATGQFGMSLLATVMASDHRPAYLDYEEKLATCAAGLKIQEVTSSGNGILARSEIEIITSFRWLLGEPLPSAETLEELLAALNEKATLFDARTAEFLDGLRARNLAPYTVEQEADQLASEVLAQLGIDPALAVVKHLETGKRHQSGHTKEDWERFQGTDMEECERLHTQGWRDAGVYQFIPVGYLGTPHHGACFRAFDISREILAHGYTIAPEKVVPDPALWQQVTDEAQRQQDRPVPVHQPQPIRQPGIRNVWTP